MAKKRKSESGFFLYYSWLEDLMLLDACERGETVYALYRYITKGEPMKNNVRGELTLFAEMLEGKVGEELQKIREKKDRREKRKNGEKTEKESSKERVKREDKREKAKKEKNKTKKISPSEKRARGIRDVVFEEDGERVTYGDFLKNVFDYFSVNCYVSDPKGFVAYNESRGWRGIVNEDVIENLSRYADMWERNERLRRGLSLKGIKTFDEYDRQFLTRQDKGVACTLPWVDFDVYG